MYHSKFAAVFFVCFYKFLKMYKLFFVPGIQKTGSGAGSAALFQKIK
jgi:hypothetical protein